MQFQNRIKALWREGKTATIGWMFTPDTFLAEVLAHVGFDGLVLDMQHGMGIGPDRAALWLQTVASTPTVPLVRVPWNEPAYFQWVLDAGAHGVIVPLIRSVEDAVRAGQACRYHPIGIRSVGPNRARFIGDDYITRANDEVICLVMIEDIATIPLLDEIAQTPGIDGFYIGPSDLAVTMGLPAGQGYKGPEHEAALQAVLDAAKRRGLVAGCHGVGHEDAIKRAEQGFQVVMLGTDHGMLGAAASNALKTYQGQPSRQ